MCGRNSLFPPAATLEDRFDARVVMEGYTPRYNIAPASEHPVITNAAPEEIDAVTWGFPAPWDESSDGLINARSETAAERPAFREAWAERPCLVPSSGFYEWQERRDGPNRPYRIHRPGDPAFALAGLWTENGAPRMTILTTEPNDTLAPIHDRMPVVLEREDERRWLAGDPDERRALCRPYAGDDLVAYPIDRRVNDPSNDDPSIIEPTTDPQTGLDRFV